VPSECGDTGFVEVLMGLYPPGGSSFWSSPGFVQGTPRDAAVISKEKPNSVVIFEYLLPNPFRVGKNVKF
jgi:hypothetical protein